ncbi:MAG: GNAT family protein [Synechococcaceae cyanobacterium ELA445]
MTELRLRGFKAEDIDVIQLLWDDPETALLISNRVSLPSQATIIKHFTNTNTSNHRVIIANRSNQAIGYACYENLCSVSRTYRIGLCLLPTARHHGLGSTSLGLLESFLSSQWMAHKLQAEVLDINEASKKLFAKSQYRCVGTMRSHFLVGGTYYDTVLFEKLIR